MPCVLPFELRTRRRLEVSPDHRTRPERAQQSTPSGWTAISCPTAVHWRTWQYPTDLVRMPPYYAEAQTHCSPNRSEADYAAVTPDATAA